MTLVLMATHPWGTLWDSSGNVQPGEQASFTNIDDATAVTHYADADASSPSTGPVTADANGRLMRWVAEDSYDMELPDATVLQVEATSGRTLRSIGTEVAVIKEAPLNVKLAENGGALFDGSDDAAAIAVAVSRLPSSPLRGELDFGQGTCTLSSFPNLDASRGIKLIGRGCSSDGQNPLTCLKYTGTGTSPFISAKDSDQFMVQDMDIRYTSSSFTGHLIDLRMDSDFTSDFHFKRVMLGGQPTSVRTAQSLVRTLGSHGGVFSHTTFMGAINAVWGLEVGETESVNGLTFDQRCKFWDTASYPIRNPGAGWLFDGPTIEPISNGEAAFLYVEATAPAPAGVTIREAWAGDVSLAGGEWIRWRGSGLHLEGGWWGVEAGGKVVVVQANDCRSIEIVGVSASGNGGADALIWFQATTGHTGVRIVPGTLTNISKATGTLPGGLTAYAASNVTVDRTYDADTVAVAELADIVGTMIEDLKIAGVLT